MIGKPAIRNQTYCAAYHASSLSQLLHGRDNTSLAGGVPGGGTRDEEQELHLPPTDRAD